MKHFTVVWYQRKISQRLVPAMIMVIAGILLALSVGCNDTTTEPSSSGQIGMTAKYSPSDSPLAKYGTVVTANNVTGSMAIDSLRITRARFVLRDIKYKTQSDSSMFRAAPFVLELDLASVPQGISIAEVPFGNYRRVEFDVHRIGTADVSSLPVSEQAQFQDFLAGDRYSIIITGTRYTGGQPSAFTFKSRVNVKQKLDIVPELVLSQASPTVNATMLISSNGWFKSSSGVLLDPTDPLNENTISDNLRASIRVFKDNNKDGSKDSN